MENLKIKRSGVDEIVYIICVVCSLGAVWLARIIISQAMRNAFGGSLWEKEFKS
jgi:hypothetical protein